MTLVCVQPLLTKRARESEEYTRDKTDDKDAVLIARLVAQLRCYAPERADETWARLRHLGARQRASGRGIRSPTARSWVCKSAPFSAMRAASRDACIAHLSPQPALAMWRPASPWSTPRCS